MKRRTRLVATLTLLPLALAACGSASGAGAASASTVSYWLWDSNQQPAYQQCADAFHVKNPNITVKITQKGWDDYWSAITTGMVSGTAPDVGIATPRMGGR